MTRTEGISVGVIRVLPQLVVFFAGPACMYETRRVFLSSGNVLDANVLVNLYFSDSYHKEAPITASE
jgi:hypothetical protein